LFIFLSRGLDGNDANGSVSVARFDKAEKALALEAGSVPQRRRCSSPSSRKLQASWKMGAEPGDR
jgi:hypothetical protein